MMAKCEFSDDDIGKLWREKFRSIGGYKKLKTECNETGFYAEMIRECGYFRHYLGMAKK
jgi:hypothetical protein